MFFSGHVHLCIVGAIKYSQVNIALVYALL